MQLEFKKQNGLYEVEFEVTGNFNLHLERKNYGRIELYQKTSSETNYTSSPSYSANGDAVINLDFSMGIYPKFVKIISYTEVEKAIVTMDSESGGSGAGGGLRPATADDIQVELYKEMVGSSIIEDWTNELEIPSHASLDIYSKKGNPIYVNTSTLVGFNMLYVSPLSKTSIYNGAQGALNITLDIYIKD